MKKILVQFPLSERNRCRLEALCEGKREIVYIREKIGEAELKALLPGTEILFADVNPAWLTDAPDLKWVQISWAGVKPYIGQPMMEKVVLTNASGAFGVTIAEHAVGMLLMLARNFRAYTENAKNGLWKDAGCEWGLYGRTALLLGAGDIGSRIAERLTAFGMHTVGLCRSMREDAAPFDELITTDRLDEYLPLADAVFGQLPETPDTVNMLDAQRLDAMKDDAIIVNCGRGSLIDTNALVSLLSNGKFRGVGLDVTKPEPLPAEHPLWGFENVIITPHISGIGFGHLEETTDRIWDIALKNLAAYDGGEPLINIVDDKAGY